jgi:hypothetical protein
VQVSVTLKELGLDNPTGYHIEDLYDDHVYGIVTPDRRFKVDVNPSGSELKVLQPKIFYVISPIKNDEHL